MNFRLFFVALEEPSHSFSLSLIAHEMSLVSLLANLKGATVLFGHLNSQLKEVSGNTLSHVFVSRSKKKHDVSMQGDKERRRQAGVEREWGMNCETKETEGKETKKSWWKDLKNKTGKVYEFVSWVVKHYTMCLIHSTVPDLLSGRCDSDESRETMKSDAKQRGHMQDWVLMHKGDRRRQREGRDE